MGRKGYQGRARPGERPQTREQWQEAVDGAHVLLLLSSARQYGLLAGGPVANVERCRAILEQGAALHIRPAPDAVERWARALAEGEGTEQ